MENVHSTCEVGFRALQRNIHMITKLCRGGVTVEMLSLPHLTWLNLPACVGGGSRRIPSEDAIGGCYSHPSRYILSRV